MGESQTYTRRSVLALPWYPPRPHRPAVAPILHLPTHSGPCYPRQLADWWGYSEDTVTRWITEGYRTCRHKRCRGCPRIHLRARRRTGRRGYEVREWEIRVTDALAFEIAAGWNILRPFSRT